MTFVVIILILLTTFSLYEYRNSRDLKNITTMISKSKYKNTVHELQRYQTYILSFILGGLIVVIALTSTVYDNMVFVSHVIEQTNPQEIDTIDITFNLPPPEEEKHQQEIQKLVNFEAPDVQNAVANQEADEGKQNYVGDATNPHQQNANATVEDVKEFERQLFEDAGGASQRAEIQKQREETQRRKEKFEQDQKNAKTNKNQSGGTSTKKGKTMVSFYLPSRNPHNNDISNIRNPGYTCEQGSYGEVTIKIKVNSLGQVTSATPAASYSDLNSCLVEQALKYAKISRFNASDVNNQEGTITYIFMP